jgi:hypothetical protein
MRGCVSMGFRRSAGSRSSSPPCAADLMGWPPQPVCWQIWTMPGQLACLFTETRGMPYHFVHGHRTIRERHKANNDAEDIVPASVSAARLVRLPRQFCTHITVRFFILYCARIWSMFGALPVDELAQRLVAAKTICARTARGACT